MGNSRVLFIGALSLILGFYSLGIKRADSRVQELTVDRASLMQAREIGESGVRIAIRKLITSNSWFSQSSQSVSSGTLTISAVNFESFGYNWAYISSFGEFNSREVRIEAWAEKINGRWIVKMIH